MWVNGLYYFAIRAGGKQASQKSHFQTSISKYFGWKSPLTAEQAFSTTNYQLPTEK